MNNTTLQFACMCSVGKRRLNNEDNFFCAGTFLPAVNDGLKNIITGEVELTNVPEAYAVFDGMGGEKNGEIAAFLAADCFNRCLEEQNVALKDPVDFLNTVSYEMNEAVCAYSLSNERISMGSTAAVLYFFNKEVFVCNVGDSRIYRLSEDDFSQITKDHTVKIPGKIKTPLLQYLGVYPSDMKIEPYIAKGLLRAGDCYLCCSDGLTDMVEDKVISNILKGKESLETKMEQLIDVAFNNGGVDNITILLCKVLSTEENNKGVLHSAKTLSERWLNKALGRNL